MAKSGVVGSVLDWFERYLTIKILFATLLLGAALTAFAWFQGLSWTGRIVAGLIGIAMVLLIVVLAQTAMEKWRARQASKSIGGGRAGAIAAQGLTDIAFAGWERALAQTEKTGQAEQEKARLATDLATEKATNAVLSSSVTELSASNRELARLAQSNLILAQRIEEMRLQGEQRFGAALTTLQNITVALWENAGEDRDGKALSFARQFWEAVEFYIKTPPSPRPDGFPPGLPTEAMSRFRAIGLSPAAAVVKVTAVTPMLSSGPDSEAPPSTGGAP